jgi:hypothetical protein
MKLTSQEIAALGPMLHKFVSGVDDARQRGILVELLRKIDDLPDAAGLRHGPPRGMTEPKLVPGKSRRIPRKS